MGVKCRSRVSSIAFESVTVCSLCLGLISHNRFSSIFPTFIGEHHEAGVRSSLVVDLWNSGKGISMSAAYQRRSASSQIS